MKIFKTITWVLVVLISACIHFQTNQKIAPFKFPVENLDANIPVEKNPTLQFPVIETPEESISEAGYPTDYGTSIWLHKQPEGAPEIRISLSRQRAYLFKGGQLAGISLISTGREGYETPIGEFKVIRKIKTHRSGTYGSFKENGTGRIIQSGVNRQITKVPPGSYYEGSPMFYYINFAPEIGMHSGYLPGEPASHGCVRMPLIMAQHFFESTTIGTPVIVEQ